MTEFTNRLSQPIYTIMWDGKNGGTWKPHSRWETVDQAIENIPVGSVCEVIKQVLVAGPDGEIYFDSLLTVVDTNGHWHPLYDPRSSDPEWTAYVRLCEKFGDL